VVLKHLPAARIKQVYVAHVSAFFEEVRYFSIICQLPGLKRSVGPGYAVRRRDNSLPANNACS
jgi:hypothetical protein